MSQNMSDRISEDMLDKMPENISDKIFFLKNPIIKYINIIIRIIQNKLIIFNFS